jgi:hypothetical protein
MCPIAAVLPEVELSPEPTLALTGGSLSLPLFFKTDIPIAGNKL